MMPATPSDGQVNPIFRREGSGSGSGGSDADSNAEAVTAAATAVETEGTSSQLVVATATQRETDNLPSATSSAAAGHGPSHSLPVGDETAASIVQPGTEGDTGTGSLTAKGDLCLPVASLAPFVQGLAVLSPIVFTCSSTAATDSRKLSLSLTSIQAPSVHASCLVSFCHEGFVGSNVKAVQQHCNMTCNLCVQDRQGRAMPIFATIPASHDALLLHRLGNEIRVALKTTFDHAKTNPGPVG